MTCIYVEKHEESETDGQASEQRQRPEAEQAETQLVDDVAVGM